MLPAPIRSQGIGKGMRFSTVYKATDNPARSARFRCLPVTPPVTHLPVPLRGIFTITWGLRPVVSDITPVPLRGIFTIAWGLRPVVSDITPLVSPELSWRPRSGVSEEGEGFEGGSEEGEEGGGLIGDCIK